MIIFLAGMPGVGKSFWMKKLKRHYACAAIDLDRFIEAEMQETIPQLFAKGEMVFRQAERDCLHKLAAQYKDLPCVIATGGGTPCFFDNMDFMLEQGKVIYLKGTPAFIYSRLSRSRVPRPLFDQVSPEDRLGLVENLLEQREPFYEKSTHTLDALSLTMANFAQFLDSLQF